MKNWTEFHIGIVYYSGLLLSLLAGLITVLYLSPVKSIFQKIVTKFEAFWRHSFKSSIILAGLIGAMSVSFKDCSGKYDYLLNSPEKTLIKGMEQISKSFEYVAFIIGIWLVVFIILSLILVKKGEQKSL